MYGENPRRLVLLVMLILYATTAACTPSSPLTAKAPLMVLGTLSGTGMPEVVEAHIVISRGKHVVEETVPVINNEFTATVQVPVGEWEVTVLLVDAQGIVLFQSKSHSTKISVSQSQLLELVLRPADTKVHIKIDVENYIFKHEALRARVHFDDEIYEIVRPDSLTPLETTIELAPGSYEFKVELYTESFRIGDRLGPGVWEVVHLAENEELFINWSPVTEALQISGCVETLLPCPQNLTLTERSDGVLITWAPVNHWEVVGYFLFAQGSLLERFELLNPIPLEETSYLHTMDADHPPEINYVVAAVSTSGLVGYYSPPQVWRP